MAQQIEQLGGEAMVIGANMGKVRSRLCTACHASLLLAAAALCAPHHAVKHQLCHPRALILPKHRLALLRHLLSPRPCICDGPPLVLVQREDIERLFSEVTDKWGTVNVLVNNAVSSWRQH